MGDPIHAVIGVWHRGAETFYVLRSGEMRNYPLVWSLLSIQFDPAALPNPLDLSAVQPVMDRMSGERLNGAPVRVVQWLSSSSCADNPMGVRVFLHLYEVGFDEEPVLNPAFYLKGAWMTPGHYQEASSGTCGLCMRMWSDHCVRHGLADMPFAPPLVRD